MAHATSAPEVLLVDDEELVLRGLARYLSMERPHWRVRVATSAERALEQLALHPADVCVSDLGLGDVDGIALLGEIAQRYPRTVRVLYSAALPEERAAESADVAHQAFTKGAEPRALVRAVESALQAAAPIADRTLWALIAGDNRLPPAPSVFLRLEEAARNTHTTTEDLTRIVAHDTAVSARVLQLASSAFLGLPPHVRTLEGAVAWLGLQKVRALVLSVEVYRGFAGQMPPPLTASGVSAHSFRVAEIAVRIARQICPGDAEVAFMAGVVHDLGVLVLATRAPERYAEVLRYAAQHEITPYRAEQAILGTTHAVVGAAVMELWGLPDSIVDAVRGHHEPPRGRRRTAAAALYVANQLLDELDEGPSDELDASTLAAMGIPAAKLDEWRSLAEGAVL